MKKYEVKYLKNNKWIPVTDRTFYSYDEANGYSKAIIDFYKAKAVSVTEETDNEKLKEISLKMENDFKKRRHQ